MIRLLRLFFVLLAPLGFSSAQTNPEIPAENHQYYFSTELNPRYQFIGLGPISPPAAVAANCYEFTYGPDKKLVRLEYQRATVAAPDPNQHVPRIDFEYATGLEKRWFRDGSGQPFPNALGVYGEALTLGAHGEVTRITNLDATGNKMTDELGVQEYVRTLDDKGRVVSLLRLGFLGTAITAKDGLYETRTVYDNKDNPLEHTNYDANGHLLNDEDGIASVRRTFIYNPDTIEVDESNFADDGQPVVEASTGIHLRKKILDKRNFLLSVSYYDERGGPTLDKDDRIHEHQWTYDDQGNIICEQFFGLDGQLKEPRLSGCAKTTTQYDEQNRIIEKSYFGDDGKPTFSRLNGAAIIAYEYDAQGRLARLQFFDEQRHPVIHAKYKAPSIRLLYQDHNRTLTSLRDANDQPMVDPVHGYASFSAPTGQDDPPLGTVYYYNLKGVQLSAIELKYINPYLYALQSDSFQMASARVGLSVMIYGAFLAALLALRKALLAQKRHAFISSKVERFMGLLAVFLIGEGAIRFWHTAWYFYNDINQVRMGPELNIFEFFFISFYLYRFWRMRRNLRVYNIEKAQLLQLLNTCFQEKNLSVTATTKPLAFSTNNLKVRIKYLASKKHAAITFRCLNATGISEMNGLTASLRHHIHQVPGSRHRWWFEVFYIAVALAYITVGDMALYGLYVLFIA